MTLLPAGPGGAPRGRPAYLPMNFRAMSSWRRVADMSPWVGVSPVASGCMPSLEVRIARVKLCVPWLVKGCGLRDDPTGRATVTLVSSLAVWPVNLFNSG